MSTHIPASYEIAGMLQTSRTSVCSFYLMDKIYVNVGIHQQLIKKTNQIILPELM